MAIYITSKKKNGGHYNIRNIQGVPFKQIYSNICQIVNDTKEYFKQKLNSFKEHKFRMINFVIEII